MKKSILALSLTCVLVIGGSTLTFAANNLPMNKNINNTNTKVETLMDSGLSFEDAKKSVLDDKLKRVDDALENGTITEERAAEIKKDMIERSSTCTTPGENKSEKPNYGLNKGLRGNGKGSCNRMNSNLSK